MLVYGDLVRRVRPSELLAEVRADLRAGDPVSALIGLGQLAQGLADAEFQERGVDARSPVQDALIAALVGLAWAVGPEIPVLRQAQDEDFYSSRSSTSSSSPHPELVEGRGRPLNGLADLVAPWTEIEVRIPEGYAFYALHPVLYAAAARELPPVDWFVIGLRSIGTSLAAVVAAALGARSPVTVRPTGDPFARTLALAPELEAELRGHSGRFVIVDEGPGLSGSSFGAAAKALERLGVERERIAFLPGHGGDLGPQASPEHGTRWAGAVRPVASFDAVLKPRLEAAVASLVGPATAPWEDLSGGAWRTRLPADGAERPPVSAGQERLKFLHRTAGGPWLIKFAGLGRLGQRKLARAQALHAAGFTPEPAGLAHGFLVERWIEPLAPTSPSTELLGDYLALRAGMPAESGASIETLWEMIRVNAAEALGPPAETALDRLQPDLPRLETLSRRVQTDGRLHAWEWITAADGRPSKTDALDHCEAHDLVGAQAIAWDLAGAEIELDLAPEQVEGLRARLDVHSDLLAFHRLAYAAFQLGLWTMAGEPDQAGGYARRLAARLGVDPPPPPG